MAKQEQPSQDKSKQCDFSFQLNGHSHYCVFRVRLRQTVAFPQGDRKFPISVLTQPTVEKADRCV